MDCDRDTNLVLSREGDIIRAPGYQVLSSKTM